MARPFPTEEHQHVPHSERQRVPTAARPPADPAANDDAYHLQCQDTDRPAPAPAYGDVETSPVTTGLIAHATPAPPWWFASVADRLATAGWTVNHCHDGLHLTKGTAEYRITPTGGIDGDDDGDGDFRAPLATLLTTYWPDAAPPPDAVPSTE